MISHLASSTSRSALQRLSIPLSELGKIWKTILTAAAIPKSRRINGQYVFARSHNPKVVGSNPETDSINLPGLVGCRARPPFIWGRFGKENLFHDTIFLA